MLTRIAVVIDEIGVAAARVTVSPVRVAAVCRDAYILGIHLAHTISNYILQVEIGAAVIV